MQGGLSLKKSFKRRALELLFHIIAILSLSYYTIYTFVISAGVDEAFATFSVLIYWSIYLLIAGFLAPKKKRIILCPMVMVYFYLFVLPDLRYGDFNIISQFQLLMSHLTIMKNYTTLKIKL